VTSLGLLEELPGRGLLVEVVGGRRDGELLVLVDGGRGRHCRQVRELLEGCEVDRELLDALSRLAAGPPAEVRRASRRAAPEQTWPSVFTTEEASIARSDSSRAVAARLLESLLDECQLASWRRGRRFEVKVPQGVVQLGELYNLWFRANNGTELSLCVVPREHRTLPVEDIWTNLLLTLRADPNQFFRVANYRPYGSSGAHRPGPVPLV